jgi:DNA-directed RNA polymerase subunit RPC12/RpoP
MASLVEVLCPHCEQNLKVPPAVFGKKVRCKHCELAFVAEDPATKPAPKARSAKPATKVAPPKPKKVIKAEAVEPAAKSPFLDEDEGVEKVEVIKEDDVPRCPHCAKELDPPDAKVCLHCGFNNLTRERAETKKVIEATPTEKFLHVLPGILGIVLSIVLVGVNIWFMTNVREWMVGTIVDMDEKDAAGRPKFYIHPAAFMFAIGIISARLILQFMRVAYRRLILNPLPEERVKK